MVREPTTDLIITGKLQRPPVDSEHVHRPRLLEQLDLQCRRPLTLVSAPAGYGKSTLVSCWLASCDTPNAWLSLDKNDSNLRLFISYFIAAVEKLFPGACRNTQAMLRVPDLPPLPALSSSLLNELSLIEQSFILVLDDYHIIKEIAVHNLLTDLLEYPPQSMHLVIIGRKDPPLQISTLRARSVVTEIRTQDLRFTQSESETLLNQLLEIQIDPTTAIALEEKTEGWVTGLYLMAIFMRHQGKIDSKMLETLADTQYVMEYLFNEVLSHQPPEISGYLLGTAILDRFSGPLCDALCVPGAEPSTCKMGGWEFIAWLKKENLFLVPLDPENRWFRYHHLFQKLLFNRLKRNCSAEEIKTLHTQASAWFAENGLVEEALRHALAAGDVETAGSLVARHGHNLMNDQQWPTLERWLGMLPRNHIEQDPELLVFEGWLIHVKTAGFDFSAYATCLEKLETLLSNLPAKASTRSTQVKGHFDAQNAFRHWVSADGERALNHSRAACEYIPIHHKRARVFAHIFQAGAYQMVGELKTGLSMYHHEMQKNIHSGSAYHAMYLANLCYIYWIDGDLTAMRQTAELSMKIAMEQRMYEAVAFSLYFIGIALYHQNNLQIAEEKLTRMSEDFYFYVPTNHGHGSYCLSLIYLAQGQPDKASEHNREMMTYATDTGNQDMLLTTQAFEAELALRQGRLAEASNWARRFRARPFLPPFSFYMPQLTAVKILLAQNTADSQRQAADLLDQLHDFLTSIHNIRFQIDVLSLQALLHDSLGEVAAALEVLTKAIDLAESGGFIRLFTDLGPRMADLLKTLLKQNVAVGYISRILAAFKEDAHKTVLNTLDPNALSPPVLQSLQSEVESPGLSSIQPLVEHLTNRELAILELTMQQLSNRDIAAKLIISIGTVKKHLSNIYRKLKVNKRWQACEKAVALGILTRR